MAGHEHLEEVTLVQHTTGERRTVPAGGLVVKISGIQTRSRSAASWTSTDEGSW